MASAHDLGGIHHVVDVDIFVRLMRQIENARAVGDAIVHAADAVDVLLVVSAGRDDIFRRTPKHRLDRRGDRVHDRGLAGRSWSGMTSHSSRSS